MSEQPSDDERRAWHRRFAIETNNRAWALVEQPALTGGDRDELLHTACASAHHWRQVGTDRNRALADVLLAYAYARLGHAALAQSTAAQALAFFEDSPSEPWERAFVHAAMAAAAAAAGDAGAHTAHYRQARAIADTLDTEEQSIFMASFGWIPEP